MIILGLKIIICIHLIKNRNMIFQKEITLIPFLEDFI